MDSSTNNPREENNNRATTPLTKQMKELSNYLKKLWIATVTQEDTPPNKRKAEEDMDNTSCKK